MESSPALSNEHHRSSQRQRGPELGFGARVTLQDNCRVAHPGLEIVAPMSKRALDLEPPWQLGKTVPRRLAVDADPGRKLRARNRAVLDGLRIWGALSSPSGEENLAATCDLAAELLRERKYHPRHRATEDGNDATPT